MITIEDFKKKQTSKTRLIGLDLGSKRIGVSICDEKQSIATPYKTIDRVNTANFIDELKEIIKENNIKGIVIGNPINMDGSKGKSSQSAISFAKNLSNNITIPIVMWDERLSSEGSFKITSELGTNVSNRVSKLDMNAAAFILQGAIDHITNN